MSLLRYDSSGVRLADLGITDAQHQALEPGLVDARQQVVESDPKLLEGPSIPPDREPLDAAFYLLPERLLE